MLRLGIVLCWLLISTPAGSATYYVNQGHVSASDSNAGTSDSGPWLTLKKATNTAVAGDTVIVKAGTYIDFAASNTHPYPAHNPLNNGMAGNPITFRSEPALAATIEARDWDGVTSGAYLAWGLKGRSYITIDGFSIVGGIRASSSNNVTIKNCEVVGGFHPPSDPSLLWGLALENSSNGMVKNNYVHTPLTSGNNSHNAAGVMLFGTSTNNVIEYNTVDGGGGEFYSAFGVKGGGTDDNTWRYNFGDDVTAGFFGMGATAGDPAMYRSIIHNNVVINTESFLEMYKLSYDFDVYNNTLYNAGKFIWAVESSSSGLDLWNNVAAATTTFIYWDSYQVPTSLPLDLLDLSDYNSHEGAAWYKREASTVTYSLSQWQANTTFGDNSTVTVPAFVNAGGGVPEDYKRVSYPADGRGGSYAATKGAYATGSEIIGFAVEGPPTDITPPSCSVFTLSTPSTSLSVPVAVLTCSDNVGVTGYYWSESSNPPAIGATWQAKPTSITVGGLGLRTVYLWARDAAGNISASRQATVHVNEGAAGPLSGAMKMGISGRVKVTPAGLGVLRFSEVPSPTALMIGSEYITLNGSYLTITPQ